MSKTLLIVELGDLSPHNRLLRREKLDIIETR